MLTGIEEVKQTHKVHFAMLCSLQNQLNAKNGKVSQQLPEACKLPICTYEEVDKVEKLLKDGVIQKILVIVVFCIV